MDELSFWLNNKPPAIEGGEESEDVEKGPPRHFATSNVLAMRLQTPHSYQPEHRKGKSWRSVSLPRIPFIGSLPSLPSLAELAAIRLPRLAEPVLVAGSVTALVVTATFGVSSMDDGGTSTATLAADRGAEGAASRSNPVGEDPPVDVAKEGDVHIPETAAANPEPAKTESTQPKAKAEPKKAEAPKAPVAKAVAPKKDAGPVGDDVWKKLASCEAGGRNDTGAPYYGYFQFSPKTWASVGGTGLPSDHTYDEQKAKAQELQKRSGWGQWPACSSKLGLRG